MAFAATCEDNSIYKTLKKGILPIGEMLLEMQKRGNLQTSQKESIHSILTIADTEAETRLMDFVRKNFPPASTLSEESSPHLNEDTFWVIDPIDGTSYFEHGLNDWTITLAFIENRKLSFCMTYAPTAKEIYFAQAGYGAFLNGKRIGVSSRNTLKDCIIYMGNRVSFQDDGRMRRMANSTRALWLTGSTALALANVAVGRLEGAIQMNQPFWDIAAGMLLIREAGGKVTNWDGEEEFDMTGAQPKKNSIFATNGHVHMSLLDFFKG